MKKIFLLFIILALKQAVTAHGLLVATEPHNIQTDSLSAYTGKYKLTRQKQSIFLQLDIVNNELIATQAWDGEKMLVKHLSGDKFIVAGFDWPVKFERDADGSVIKIIVRGTDLWVKEKS